MTAGDRRRRTRTRRPSSAAGLPLLLAAGSAPVALLNSYLAALTVAAYVRRGSGRPRPTSGSAPGRRFAVLIPAHDEAGIIGSTIDSIVGQRYPTDLLRVHVVADNCTDATAEIAREHGAEVHERFDGSAPGKGPALGWLVRQLEERGDQSDAIVIIDADTTMALDFLEVVDAAFADGVSAWQAYYKVRDPEVSASTALRQAALALRHYVRPLGRNAFGGSSGLFGNGMIFRTELLRRRQFSAHLTEDVEFQLELLLDGELVTFVPDAVVEAEMPTTFTAARTQNERWELGRLQLARRFLPELVGRAFRPGGRRRAAYLDAALDQSVPPLSVLAVGTSALAVAATVLPRARGSRLGRAGTALAWVSVLGLAFHVIAGLRLARVPRAVYLALLQAPRLVAWKLALWLRVLVRPSGVSWKRTERNDPAGGPVPMPW